VKLCISRALQAKTLAMISMFVCRTHHSSALSSIYCCCLHLLLTVFEACCFHFFLQISLPWCLNSFSSIRCPLQSLFDNVFISACVEGSSMVLIYVLAQVNSWLVSVHRSSSAANERLQFALDTNLAPDFEKKFFRQFYDNLRNFV